MVALSNNFSLARMVDPVWPGCEASSTPEFHAWHTATQTPVFSWSSQARGFFNRGRPDFTPDAELTRSWYSPDNFARKQRAEVLAAKMGVSPTNIAVAWILHQPFPVHALIGPNCFADFRDSLKGLSVTLTPEEVRWLDLGDD